MTFNEMTKKRFESLNTVLTIGLDPVVERIPVQKKSIKETITNFLNSIIDNFHNKAIAVKPNIAFFEQYGIEGLEALQDVVDNAHKYDLPVIIDAKRGDIGNTSLRYAKSLFDNLKADAITLAPYMGLDSVDPFFSYEDKGFFILGRTSNPGSSDFQLLKLDNGKYLYEIVIEKIAEWNAKYNAGIGAVAGATHTNEFENICKLYKNKDYPLLLIPGVGKQGGSFDEITGILKKYDYPLNKIFINSSSGILYAHEKNKDMDWLEACEMEINKLQLKS